MISRVSNIRQVSARVIKAAFRQVRRDLFSFRSQSIRKAPDRIAQLKGFLDHQELKTTHYNMRLLYALKKDGDALEAANIRSALDQFLISSPENYLRQPLEYLPIEITMRLLLRSDPALKGLQLASNYGPYLIYLKEKHGFTDLTGIDIDHHAIAYAGEIGSPAIKGSASSLPFETSSLDLVISNNFLAMDYAPIERVYSPGLQTFIRKVANEVHRVLKPGGFFISLDECVAELDRIPFEPPHVYSEEAITELPPLAYVNVFQKEV